MTKQTTSEIFRKLQQQQTELNTQDKNKLREQLLQFAKQIHKHAQNEIVQQQKFPRQISFQFRGEQYKFTIIKKLGSGVSANVYLIRDENNNDFALKQGLKNKKHFIQEQNTILQKFKQKNLCDYFICPIMYIPRQNSADIIMSYLNNYIELKTALGQNYSITKRNKQIIKRKLKEGLNKLHENNFIHSDVKPGNIMVKVNETKKKILNDAKIIDMGGVIEFQNERQRKCIRMITPVYTDFHILFPHETNLTQKQLHTKYKNKLHKICFDFDTLKQVDNKALEKVFDKIDKIGQIKPKKGFFSFFNFFTKN